MSKETGGPAFPIWHETSVCASGMALRDYFAAMALSTAAGYPAEDVATWSADDFAMHAYNIADAMLKYRTK